MLPTYQRFNNSSSGKIRSFRASEKILIFLVFISFLVIVLFGFFLLPDLSASSKVLGIYDSVKRGGPQIFIPAPPIERPFKKYESDQDRLRKKIELEFNDVDSGLEKPDIQQPAKVPVVPIPVPDSKKNSGIQEKKSLSTDSTTNDVYNVDGQDQDSTARKRRDKVKEVSENEALYVSFDL